MQTEKAKSSHFDRTRGDKNQIFPTLDNTTLLDGKRILGIVALCGKKSILIKSQQEK